MCRFTCCGPYSASFVPVSFGSPFPPTRPQHLLPLLCFSRVGPDPTPDKDDERGVDRMFRALVAPGCVEEAHRFLDVMFASSDVPGKKTRTAVHHSGGAHLPPTVSGAGQFVQHNGIPRLWHTINNFTDRVDILEESAMLAYNLAMQGMHLLCHLTIVITRGRVRHRPQDTFVALRQCHREFGQGFSSRPWPQQSRDGTPEGYTLHDDGGHAGEWAP